MKYTAALLVYVISAAASGQEDAPDDDSFASPLDQTVPVAEEAIPPEDDTGDGANVAADSDIVTEEKLLQEFGRYRALVAEGTLDEADIAAKRIVEMAIKVYGPQSRETASALNNLGIVQHSNGQFDAAIQNFTSSVEIIEAVEDRLSSGLVNPLRGLGAAQMSIGRPDQANRTFIRAAHITQVNEGPHNIEQTEILELIAEAQLRLGQMKQARKTLDRIHLLNVRFFEKDPLGLIPSLMNRASWQHRAGYYGDERVSYRRAIRIVEAGGGKDNPMLIEPLRKLGESFYFVDVSGTQQNTGLVTTGEMYFKRAARIAEETDGLDWRELVDTKLALADYYNYIDSQNRSRKIYREMWAFLSGNEERLAMRAKLFNDPVPTREESLPKFLGRSDGSKSDDATLLTGRITVDYTVNTRGRVKNLRTTAIPPEFTDIQRMVHREVRQRVYRPRIVDGVPAQAEEQFVEHTFSYTAADLEKLKEQFEASPEKASKNK